MGTDVSVVIAYRDMGCPHRRDSFNYVRGWYELFYGYEVIVESGDSDATFTRASAINAGVRRASGWIIVQSDPDSLVLPAQLDEAIQAARTGDWPVVIPHNQYLYATQDATADVLSGESYIWDITPAACETHGSDGSGNVVVFTRDLWEQVGGFDERFGLWGGDDAAFRYAAEAFSGPVRRLEGPMVHLWHPRLPQSVPGAPGYAEQFSILAQYRDAAAIGPHAVRELVRSRDGRV